LQAHATGILPKIPKLQSGDWSCVKVTLIVEVRTRTRIRETLATPEELTVAREHLHPEELFVVAVGRAANIEVDFRKPGIGPLSIVSA